MPAISQQFGKRLREAIGRRGTQRQFADAMNITPPGLSNFLNGRVPDGLLLKRFADALGVTMSWLLTGEETAHSTSAHEATAPYGEVETPEEKKYYALLLRILRSKNKKSAEGIKASIEAFAEREDRDFLKKVHGKKAANGE